MKVVVGLGNPGLRYKKTKHNIGFLIVDRFAKKHSLVFSTRTDNSRRYKSATAKWTAGAEEVIFIKPLTYMNLSGAVVALLIKNTNLRPEDVLVIYDDADLELGALRFRKSGSSGGHKGVESIISHFGRDSFHRLKVGIGRDPARTDLARYVLSPFGREKAAVLDDVLNEAAAAIQAWARDGIDTAMNMFNKTKAP